MTDLPQRVLYYGRDEPLPDTLPLRAGALSVLYDNGDLRYIRLGEHEILRRVYAAVRDHNWGTVPPQLSNVQIDAGDDYFRIEYDALHQQNDIDFAWHGKITGATDGTIVFEFGGKAGSTFRRNRIGFCVLHPMDVAGRACVITHVDGSTTAGSFPEHISPHQPFLNIRAITHEVVPGVRAEVLMEGDTFEMEDQRNWTDASYKTYCTPLGLPFPVTVAAGTQVNQRITVRLQGDAVRTGVGDQASRLAITVRSDRVPLPRLGLEVASHREPLTAGEIERLRALELSHLRVVLHLRQEDVEATLQQASEEARALGVALEVVLWLSDDAEQELARLRGLLDGLNSLVQVWLVFHEGEHTTGGQWAKLVRDHLRDYVPGALIGGGTDAFFTELNRNRPPTNDLDLLSFSINPQVHAFANVDLVETLAAQAAAVRSAKAISNGLPVAVSPITFFMRWNPNATGPQPPTRAGDLPARVDPRQMSLFGAGWTVGSVKYLAESGVDRATFFETTGWLGVMERERGSPLPEKFFSVPGGVFPMYHVFAAVGAYAGGAVRVSRSSEPLVVDALALTKNDHTRVLLANFTQDQQQVTVRGLSGTVRVKSLDESNALEAMRNPEEFQAERGAAVEAVDATTVVEMKPFAIVQIDAEQ